MLRHRLLRRVWRRRSVALHQLAEGAESVPGQRRLHIRINPEDLIEPRDLEDWPHVFLQAGEREFTAVALDILHSFDQDGEARTVDVGDLREIDDDLLRLLVYHRAERDGDAR